MYTSSLYATFFLFFSSFTTVVISLGFLRHSKQLLLLFTNKYIFVFTGHVPHHNHLMLSTLFSLLLKTLLSLEGQLLGFCFSVFSLNSAKDLMAYISGGMISQTSGPKYNADSGLL